MKVYLATSGEYSDYQVLHVFASEEDAANYPLRDDVEERELQEGPVEVRTWHRITWWFTRPDSKGSGQRLSNPWEFSELRDFSSALVTFHHWHSELLVVEGWDLQHVRKVYSEQRAQHLARQQNVS